MNFFKGYKRFKDFKKAIESLRISEQLLGDKNASQLQLGVPVQYKFSIDFKKNNYQLYQDMNIRRDIIDYLEKHDNKIDFEYNNFYYSVNLVPEDDSCNNNQYDLFIWINPQDI